MIKVTLPNPPAKGFNPDHLKKLLNPKYAGRSQFDPGCSSMFAKINRRGGCRARIILDKGSSRIVADQYGVSPGRVRRLPNKLSLLKNSLSNSAFLSSYWVSNDLHSVELSGLGLSMKTGKQRLSQCANF